jgi:hypothetical protein
MTNKTGTAGAPTTEQVARHIEMEKIFKDSRATPASPPAIPEHIAKNLLEFLRRVESKGMEAVAWVEAYQFVQKYVQHQQPLPPSPT